MPRLAEAQRAAWLRLRAELRRLLKGAGDQSTRTVLAAFDALPYSASSSSTWLPSEEQLSCGTSGIRTAMIESSGLPIAAFEGFSSAVDTERNALAVTDVDTPGTVAIYGGRIQRVERRDAAEENEPLSLLVSGKRLRWLRRAHDACDSHPSDATDVDREVLFRERLYRMLARYDGLGGGFAGAGSQAAVPPGVIDAFETWAGAPAMEAFASPLNYRLTPALEVPEVASRRGRPSGSSVIHGRRRQGPARIVTPWYCSAFPDVDAPFGSRGSFFDLPALPSSLSQPPTAHAGRHSSRPPLLPIIANPPYFGWAMAQLPSTLDRLLAQPDAPDSAVLVVLPALAGRADHEAPHAAALAASPHLRHVVTLEAERHVFCQGHVARRGRPTHEFRRCRWATNLSLLSNVQLSPSACEELLSKVKEAFRIPAEAAREPGVYEEGSRNKRYFSLRRVQPRAGTRRRVVRRRKQ